MSAAATFFDKWKTGTEAMKREAPNIARGYGQFYHTVMVESVLSSREKELIAIAIALATQCTPCLYWHLRKAMDKGATPEQILEAAGVAVMMRGGPAFVHVPELLEALDYLRQSGGDG